MRIITRFELKYRLTKKQYYQVRNALIPYMEVDEFTRKSEETGYLVRSLYFDSYDYRSFFEKDDGNFGRLKLRLRSYTDKPAHDTPVSVEIKSRRGAAMEKHSVFVPFFEYRAFMERKHWLDLSSPVLTEFERIFHARIMRPVTMIQYEREGFKSRRDGDLRITFDHQVRSCSSKDLFMDRPFFRSHHKEHVVLEIKTAGDKRPGWLFDLTKKCGLQLVSNSKYAQSIQISQPDVIVPSAVQFAYPSLGLGKSHKDNVYVKLGLQ